MSNIPTDESAADILNRWIASNVSALADVSVSMTHAISAAADLKRRQQMVKPVSDIGRNVVGTIRALAAVNPASLTELSAAEVDQHLLNLTALIWSADVYDVDALAAMTPAQLQERIDRIVAGNGIDWAASREEVNEWLQLRNRDDDQAVAESAPGSGA